MILAPIVLFVYNRPWHSKQTIEALKKNKYANESELFIFCDAAKDESVQKEVEEVSKLVSNISGFKSITIVKREVNLGLADSIISGVTDIVSRYGKVIVLEDDLVTSPYFLAFMNEALDFYQKEKKVWHISGWNYPIDNDGLGDVFLWRLMNCWGWATWADRWKSFEKNTDKLINTFSPQEIREFNLGGYGKFWEQVLANKEGKINTWAIYWYAVIFNNNGLCLNPAQTYVENIGLDGSGVNCSSSDFYKSNLNMNQSYKFITSYEENNYIVRLVQKYYKNESRSLLVRIVNKVARILFKKNLIL